MLDFHTVFLTHFDHYRTIIVRKNDNLYVLEARIVNLHKKWNYDNIMMVGSIGLNTAYDLDKCYEEEFFEKLQNR